MKIAKGIKGIRKALADKATGFHITTRTQYLAFVDCTPRQIAEAMSEYGYTLIDVTGNVICFDE